MSRRAYPRFSVTPASEGVVRVLHDVVVQHSTEREVVVISHEPGVTQATLQIEFPDRDAQQPQQLSVRVKESKPLLVNGAVRHRIVLRVVDANHEMEAVGAKVEAPGLGSRRAV